MADFGHMKHKVKTEIQYTFWNIVGNPSILVRHGGEKNKPYFQARLRHATELQKRRIKEVTVDLIKDNRERDRKLYAEFIVMGFGDGVVDANGVKVPFNRENAEGFLRAVDDEEFDKLREFVDDVSNFYEVADGAGVAGNLPTA